MIFKLNNGMRVLWVPGQSRTGWCGVAIDAGSRDETEESYGLAHFVEHTIFKGAGKRKSWHILNRMEVVGGELNAYTTKEGTMIYTLFPGEHVERAAQLVSDLVSCPTFPEHEIEREREVVMEEIASFRDNPADAVYDDFEETIFAGSDLAHNVLGDAEQLRRMTRDDCHRWVNTHYTPHNMVLFIAGNYTEQQVERLAERYFGALTGSEQRKKRVAPAHVTPQRRIIDIDSHQAHVIMGVRVPGMDNGGLRYALALVNNALGGPGMNSLLNVALREKRGLVYSVESSVVTMTDCGLAEIYFGCDAHELARAEKVTKQTISRLFDLASDPRRLDAWKKQYCGQLSVAWENQEARVLGAARSFLYCDEVETIDQTIARLSAVTPNEARAAVEFLAPDRLTTLIER